MTDHIGDANKMIGDTPRMKTAQMAAIEQMTGDVWKVGCELERELNAANERIRQLIAERDTARLQADRKVSLREEFCELLGTDQIEEGVAVVQAMKARIKHLEDRIERASIAFFEDGSDRKTAVRILEILEEERNNL